MFSARSWEGKSVKEATTIEGGPKPSGPHRDGLHMQSAIVRKLSQYQDELLICMVVQADSTLYGSLSYLSLK